MKIRTKIFFWALSPMVITIIFIIFIIIYNFIFFQHGNLSDPLKEVYNSIIKTIQSVLIVSIFLLTLSFFVLTWLSSTITKPIMKLTKAADLLSHGNFKIDIDKKIIESKDEIGELAVSFEIMSNKLQKLYVEFDKKLKDRTVVLNKKVEDLERVESIMVGRELKMIELKKIIEELKSNK